MKKKFLYIFLNFIKIFIVSSIFFLVLFLVIQILDDLADLLKYKKTFVFKNYIYSLPFLFVQISPIITILSSMLILSEMLKNNEIKTLSISGVKPSKIFFIFLFCGFVVSCISFSIKNFISPVLLKKISNRITETSIVFSSPEYFFYCEKNIEGKFINVEFSEYSEDKKLRTIKAKIGENINGNEWIFKNGTIWEFDKEGYPVKKENFTFKKIYIPLTSQILSVSILDIETLSFFELLKIIGELENLKINPVSLKTYLNEKLSYPLLNFFIIFIIFPFLEYPHKISNLYVFSFSFLVSLFLYFLYALFFSLAQNGKIFYPLGAWIIPIFTLFYFLSVKFKIFKKFS